MSVPNLYDPTNPYQDPTSYDDMVVYEPTIVRTQAQKQSRWSYGRKKGPDEIVEIYNPYNPQLLEYPPAPPPPPSFPIHHPSAINNPHPNVHQALFGHPSLAPGMPHHRQPERVPLIHHDPYYSPEKTPYAHADHYRRAQDPDPASPYEVTQYYPYNTQTSTVTVQGTTPTGQMPRSVDAQPPSFSSQPQQSSTTATAGTAITTTVPTGVPPPGQPQAQPTRL